MTNDLNKIQNIYKKKKENLKFCKSITEKS